LAAPTVYDLSLPSVRARGARTRERILDAAEAVFAERGFDGATLRDVAARVGIRNPSLYNHFDSKESLYAAVLERGMRPVLELLSRWVEERGAETTSRSIVELVMRILARRPELARLVLHETLAGGQRLTPMLRSWIGPIFEKSGEAAEASGAAERWGRERLPLLVLAMYHVVVGYFTIAPLYRDISGVDLMAPEALAQQTQLFAEMVESLFDTARNGPPVANEESS
jgi:TetR/AcrR family transcriptional regulator